MKRLIQLGVCTLALACSLGWQPQAVADSPGASATAVPIMRLSEIKPGMKGIARTVFSGTKIEEFGVEIYGVLHNFIGPKKDLILVRLTGEKAEYTGVVAGMSGSPVYIDGKLIGALSYRIGFFSKEPIAGITPIESMLEVEQFSHERPAARTAMPSSPSSNLLATGETSRETAAFFSTPVMFHGSVRPEQALEPIATPLVFSGINPSVFDHFASIFQQYHLLPVRGGGSGPIQSNEPLPFEPGAPIAGLLVRGDLDIVATGTITYRDGSRVFAFGHPFLQDGLVDMPMAKAYIMTTLASPAGSFKISSTGEVVGSIRQDRLTAIMGEVGATAKLIPVDVELRTQGHAPAAYHFEITQNPRLTPLLFNISLSTALADTLEFASVSTATVSGAIKIARQPDVVIDDLFSTGAGFFSAPSAFAVASSLTERFSRLYSNTVEAPDLQSVRLSVDFTETRRTASIDELLADQQEVRPGDDLELIAYLRPYRGSRIAERFHVKVPEELRSGDRLFISVLDSASMDALDRRSSIGRDSDRVTSLEALIKDLNHSRRQSRLYVRVAESSPGVLVRDQLLPSLPLSVSRVIQSGQAAGQLSSTTDSVLAVDSREVGMVVTGNRTISVIVK